MESIWEEPVEGEDYKGLHIRSFFVDKLYPQEDLPDREGYRWFVGDKTLDKWLFFGETVTQDITSYQTAVKASGVFDPALLYNKVLDLGMEWDKIIEDKGDKCLEILKDHGQFFTKKDLDKAAATHGFLEKDPLRSLHTKKPIQLYGGEDFDEIFEDFNAAPPGKFTTFVNFKDQILGYLVHCTERMTDPEEEILNMVIIENRNKFIHLAVDPLFFVNGSGRDKLMDEILLPILNATTPEKLSIIGPGWTHDPDLYIIEDEKVEVIFMDQETVQVYAANVERDGISAPEFSGWTRDESPDWDKMEFIDPIWDKLK